MCYAVRPHVPTHQIHLKNWRLTVEVKGVSCPNCGKKTLSHPNHKEWSAWKDYSRVYCRKCGRVITEDELREE